MFYILRQRCILFFLIQLLIHNVLVQSIETREAVVGDTAILPCSINSTAEDGDVFWRYGKEEKVVVDFIMGKEDFSNQYPEYRGRIKTFPTEITNRNFSIKLINVMLSDSGIYTCNPEPVQTVELRVKESLHPDENKPYPGSRNGHLRRTSSVFLLGFSLLYSLAF